MAGEGEGKVFYLQIKFKETSSESLDKEMQIGLWTTWNS